MEQTLTDFVVELDSTLVVKELEVSVPDDFNQKITDKGRATVRDCIYGSYRHKNYLEYLRTCWANHYGVVISPDIVWHVILNELSGHIIDNSDRYRSLFTTSEDKVEIVVETGDPQLINLKLITQQLRSLVPTNIDLFVPEFTSSTEASSLAFMAAFAEAMTPYYNYSMYLCGIPKVKVLGTKQDWEKIILNLTELKGLLKISNYVDRLIGTIGQIAHSYESVDEEFLGDVFRLDRCGSGGQVEVRGWVTDLFMKTPRVAYVYNFPTCISKVPYKYLNTGQNFELCHGLFSSNESDGFLVPEFGYIINEVEDGTN
jgi:hypothetical protein